MTGKGTGHRFPPRARPGRALPKITVTFRMAHPISDPRTFRQSPGAKSFSCNFPIRTRTSLKVGRPTASGHPAHLPVSSLPQDDAEPTIRNSLTKSNWWISWGKIGRVRQSSSNTRKAFPAPEFSLPRSSAGAFLRSHPLDLHPVFSFVPLSWAKEACVPIRLIA